MSIKKTLLYVIIGVFILASILLILMKYDSIIGYYEKTIYTNSSLFVFNTNTIFEDIEDGKIDIFKPLQSKDDYVEINSDLIVTKDEFENILNSLLSEEYSENFDQIQLTTISYDIRCNDSNHQIFEGWIAYQILDKENNEKIYRRIDISFIKGLIEINESAYSPIIRERNDIIDLQKIIPVDEVLIIVDKEFGNDFRRKNENCCNIVIGIGKVYSSIHFWDATYYKVGSEESNFIKVLINAINGEAVLVDYSKD